MASQGIQAEAREAERVGRWRVSFPVTLGLLLGLGSAILIFLFIVFPGLRDVFRFALLVLATAGGLAAAYYVGKGLRVTAHSERLMRTFSFPARWGDPSWAPARNALAQLLADCQGQPDSERLRLVEQAIEGDREFGQNIRAVLNFLEEVALAINLKVVDEETIDRFYRTMVVRGYGALEPWVTKQRKEREAPRIWVEIERLYKVWEQKG